MPDVRNEQDIAGGGQSACRKCRARGRRGAVAVEAAVCMPILVAMMLAMWQIGQIAEMSRIVKDAAREGARVAAGGVNNGTPVTVANVQTAVQNFLTAAGMPSAAVNGAMVTVTDLSFRFVDQPRQCPAPGPVQRDRNHSAGRALQQLAVFRRHAVRRHAIAGDGRMALGQRHATHREHHTALLGRWRHALRYEDAGPPY